VVALVLLAGYLLFSHGCHGDEDNELFVGLRQQAALRVQDPATRTTGPRCMNHARYAEYVRLLKTLRRRIGEGKDDEAVRYARLILDPAALRVA
jgi:hypothetical protein